MSNEMNEEMMQPFDVTVNNTVYAIFPEEDDTYVVFKEGIEYVHIQKDTELQWIKLDPETGLPSFETTEEIGLIGQAIVAHVPEEEEDDEDDEEEGALD